MKKIITIISVGLMTFLISGCSFFGNTPIQQEQTPASQTSTLQVVPPAPVPKAQTSKQMAKPKTPSPTPAPQQTKEFTLTAKQWSFSPSKITVNKGDKVILHIKSIDVTHGFKLDAFGISKSLSPGKTVNVQFTADKTGTFSFFCNVFCGSGHGGMVGTLVVK